MNQKNKKNLLTIAIAIVVIMGFVILVAISIRNQSENSSNKSDSNNMEILDIETSIDESKSIEDNVDESVDDINKLIENLNTDDDFEEIEDF
jgi:uncharacterized FlaG/YvyC family protein